MKKKNYNNQGENPARGHMRSVGNVRDAKVSTFSEDSKGVFFARQNDKVVAQMAQLEELKATRAGFLAFAEELQVSLSQFEKAAALAGESKEFQMFLQAVQAYYFAESDVVALLKEQQAEIEKTGNKELPAFRVQYYKKELAKKQAVLASAKEELEQQTRWLTKAINQLKKNDKDRKRLAEAKVEVEKMNALLYNVDAVFENLKSIVHGSAKSKSSSMTLATSKEVKKQTDAVRADVEKLNKKVDLSMEQVRNVHSAVQENKEAITQAETSVKEEIGAKAEAVREDIHQLDKKADQVMEQVRDVHGAVQENKEAIAKAETSVKEEVGAKAEAVREDIHQLDQKVDASMEQVRDVHSAVQENKEAIAQAETSVKEEVGAKAEAVREDIHQLDKKADQAMEQVRDVHKAVQENKEAVTQAEEAVKQEIEKQKQALQADVQVLGEKIQECFMQAVELNRAAAENKDAVARVEVSLALAKKDLGDAIDAVGVKVDRLDADYQDIARKVNDGFANITTMFSADLRDVENEVKTQASSTRKTVKIAASLLAVPAAIGVGLGIANLLQDDAVVINNTTNYENIVVSNYKTIDEINMAIKQLQAKLEEVENEDVEGLISADIQTLQNKLSTINTTTGWSSDESDMNNYLTGTNHDANNYDKNGNYVGQKESYNPISRDTYNKLETLQAELNRLNGLNKNTYTEEAQKQIEADKAWLSAKIQSIDVSTGWSSDANDMNNYLTGTNHDANNYDKNGNYVGQKESYNPISRDTYNKLETLQAELNRLNGLNKNTYTEEAQKQIEADKAWLNAKIQSIDVSTGWSADENDFNNYLTGENFDANGYNKNGKYVGPKESYNPISRDTYNKLETLQAELDRLNSLNVDTFTEDSQKQIEADKAWLNAKIQSIDVSTGWSSDENDFNNYLTGSIFDQDGYDKFGYDINGFDRDGWNDQDIHRDTGTKYDPEGYDREGYDKYGFDRLGNSKENNQKDENKDDNVSSGSGPSVGDTGPSMDKGA